MKVFRSLRMLVLGIAVALVPAASFAGVFISVGFAPPVLPVYTQPICPGDGYLWTPGYWAYGDAGYYWVPGVWVMAPRPGLLWTPAFWGWNNGAYLFHAGYWGPHVGFYGGINYGFGYGGVGFGGGRWVGNSFAYNTAVVNVNRTVIHNTYIDRTVINNNVTYNRTSFNGGAGGVQARPSTEEMAYTRENHIPPTANQQAHFESARADRSNLAAVNGGRPQNVAMSRVGERASNQQQRVAQGVRSGQMTAGETRNVENRDASINHQVAQDRAQNNGRLTQQERQQVNQRQNNVSRSIYNDKHNAQTQYRPQPQARPQAGPRQEARPQGGGGGEHERR
ncbi:MAG: hypothetical protein M3Y50_03270 [Acidobacteriota bacterium]|nr:hypothetical protein [Acidobacteriota bacterium]